MRRQDWFEGLLAGNQRRQHELASAPRLCEISADTFNFWPMLQDVMISVARIQGAPDNIEIQFATDTHVKTGCAGFHDAPQSFLRPYIVIDRGIADAVPPPLIGEIYSGLVVHETGHVLYTRDFFRQPTTISPIRRGFQNLLEDERIESLTRQDSPGFRHVLQRTKEVLLRKTVEKLRAWRQLPDLDVIDLVIFSFVRMPHHIPEDLKQWKSADGDCVFQEIRNVLAHEPQSEGDVTRLAEALETLRSRLARQYAGNALELAAAKHNVDDETFLRQLAQAESAATDRARRWSKGDLSLTGQLRAEAERFDAVAHRCRKPTAVHEAARRLTELAKRAAADKPPENLQERRFQLAEQLRELNEVQKAFSADELKAIEQTATKAKDDPHIEEKSWSWNGNRRLQIQTAMVSEVAARRYREAHAAIANHVHVLRKVLELHLHEGTTVDREQSSGRLDRRRLVQSMFHDRLFQRSRTVSAPSLGLCLLLDESASMNSNQRSTRALQVAVMIAEAARQIPQLHLEIYSHTTTGNDHKDCLIRHMFGADQPDRLGIGDYGTVSNGANYDHQAIETVAQRFHKQTRHGTRLMLVVSDGRPNGPGYGGRSAIAATRDAVNAVRSKGTRVLGIAIGKFNAGKIYGEHSLLEFTDMSKLVSNVRNLLTRVMRS